jgi:hypothetical protein
MRGFTTEYGISATANFDSAAAITDITGNRRLFVSVLHVQTTFIFIHIMEETHLF